MRNRFRRWLSRIAERHEVGLGAVLPKGECLVVYRRYDKWEYTVLDTRNPLGSRIKSAGGWVSGQEILAAAERLKPVEEA